MPRPLHSFSALALTNAVVSTTARVFTLGTTWATAAAVTFTAMSATGFVLPSPVAAQGVSGVVVDASSSAPLPGVLVSVLNAAGDRVGAVLTDASGRFTVVVSISGEYSARAERIGLATSNTDAFDVASEGLHTLRIEMADRAVEIAGIVVDSRVQACRIDPAEAIQIQRWWGEVRKALDVSAVVQRDRLVRFRIQRYEREWSADLRSLAAERTDLQVGFSSRPFVSAATESLSQDGFVQGVDGARQYFAPDADVLLSDAFLAQHCFSVVADGADADRLGLRFEPIRSRKVPDILGTLWVDTTTAELTHLDYRYANLDWLPQNEAGGRVEFRYLPSGTWIVADWFIRMPQVGVRGGDRAGNTEVVGYVDVGGRVRQLATAVGAGDGATGSAQLVGAVFDSIRGAPLAGARVALLGSRFSAQTDAAGRFEITGLPAAEHRVAFFHADLTQWGVASFVRTVDLSEDARREIQLAVPRFRTLAEIMCTGGGDVGAILTGYVMDDGGAGLENVTVEVAWEIPGAGGAARTFTAEARTGSGGRYRICEVPAEARMELTVVTEQGRGRVTSVVLPTAEITYRELRARR